MTLTELRARLIAMGVTAESPADLGPEGERLAAEERRTET
jgi:hypothetical protein